jgi:hypothetical protein
MFGVTLGEPGQDMARTSGFGFLTGMKGSMSSHNLSGKSSTAI